MAPRSLWPWCLQTARPPLREAGQDLWLYWNICSLGEFALLYGKCDGVVNPMIILYFIRLHSSWLKIFLLALMKLTLWEDHMARTWGWPLRAENHPWSTNSKETGVSFLNYTELTSASQFQFQTDLWREHEALGETTVTDNILTSIWWYLKQKTD